MASHQALFVALPNVFASLLLLVAANVLANTDNVSNALQTGQPSSIQVTLSKQADTAIRLETRAAPLVDILKAIADKTGAQIHYSVLPPEPVTTSCTATTVSGLLECLLGSRVDRVYRYPRSGAVKLNSAKSSVDRPNLENPSTKKSLDTLAQNATTQPEEIWLLATNLPVKPGNTRNAPVPVKEPEVSTTPEPTTEEQTQIEETLKQARSKDVDERSTALYNLGLIGQKDDPNILKALEEALADKDPNVRTQAITSLMQRDSDGSAAQVQQALQDKDVNVRMAVIGNLNDEATLQQALADSDPTIRELVKSKLDDMANRQERQNHK